MTTPASIRLTPAERPAYAHLFALADPQSTGMVSGSASVSFFALSGLPTPVLGSIWTIADSDNNGFLGPAHFSAALRLIGHAQSGKVVTEDLVQEPGPMPTFKGVSLPAHLVGGSALSTPIRSSSTMIQPQATGGGGFGPSEIKPDDRARYTRIFASAGPQGGLLDGEKAKEIFVKSKLPFDKLGAIWNLADTNARGKLDLTDFIVGMHFIQSTMNGSLTTIPASLPAGVYEKAASGGAGVPSSPVGSHLGAQHTGGSAGFVSRQMTGSNQFAMPSSPMRSNIRSPPPATANSSALQPQQTGSSFPGTPVASSWAVSAADKAKSDRFFDGLDQDRKGVLEGQAAVPFFVQSGLSEATLAHIWDLSDITQSGTLSRDEFAVAMHLINLKITGSDLPSELPSTLVPPTLRGTSLPRAVNPKETDTQRDLFSLMDDDVDLPVSTASAFAVPASNGPTQLSRAAPITTSGPFDDDFMGSNASAPAPAFAPTTLSPAMTGGSTMSGGNRFAVPGSENAGTAQTPFGDASTEAANQRLALDSTQKSLSTMEMRKGELEKSVSADGGSISDLKTRLETVRMRHQTESEAVKALTERQAAQAMELRKLQEESVREESELSRLKAEKDEIEQSVMKDREDVREMKRLVGERTREKETLKAELEKLKKDARMQKGLVAIGKKQLSQADGEVASVRTDMGRAQAGEMEDEHAEHGEVPMGGAQSVSSPRGETAPEAALSPAASVRTNNPFDRMPTHAGGAAAAGAAAGIASAVGLGAAVAHHESAEPVEASSARTAMEDDPFGASQQSSAAPAMASHAAFDDSFGQFDAAAEPEAGSGNAHPEASNVNQAFDDAFADLDEPSAKAVPTAADETESVTAGVPGSFAAVDAAQPDAISGQEATDVDVDGEVAEQTSLTKASTANQVATDNDAIPANTTASRGEDLAGGDDDGQESSDEEEGPEDVGRAQDLVDSPDEVGEGKPAQDSIPVLQPASEGALQASDRFPELPDETSASNAPVAVPTTAGLSTLDTALPAAVVGTPAPLSAVHTGVTSDGGDAFHDAPSDTLASREAGESAPGSVFVPASHERFSTALENSDAGQRSVSPSKIRRAPPPAPVRSGTNSSGPNLGPFATSAAPPSSSAPLDDFDAAFEDLGPSARTGTSAANTTAMSGFDDAFGDADGFDFVPSFKDAGDTSASQAQTGGFDGFDSAFGPAFESHPQAGVSSARANNTSEGAFSFDDAFVPPEAISTGLESKSASTGLPPSSAGPAPALPSRAGTGIAAVAAPSATSPTPSTGAGALPDDAAPVRQLCAMGFSRADVIKSLEKSNYRTDKALERLLAQA